MSLSSKPFTFTFLESRGVSKHFLTFWSLYENSAQPESFSAWLLHHLGSHSTVCVRARNTSCYRKTPCLAYKEGQFILAYKPRSVTLCLVDLKALWAVETALMNDTVRINHLSQGQGSAGRRKAALESIFLLNYTHFDLRLATRLHLSQNPHLHHSQQVGQEPSS